jgi:hypothetical protein
VFLGRLIGFYCILVGLAFAARKEAVPGAAVTALIHDPAILLVLGGIIWQPNLQWCLRTTSGQAALCRWGSTLIGWISLAKGLFFVILSPYSMGSLVDALKYAQLFYLYVAVIILIGLCLVVASVRSERFTFQNGVAIWLALYRA